MAGSVSFQKGARYDFLTVLADQGWLLAIMEAQEEPLTTEGVNGTRFREVFRQHPIQTLRTLAQATDFAAATALAAAYKQSLLDSRLVTVSLSTPIVTASFQMVHVLSCKPVPLPGILAGASGSPLASVLTAWTFQFTDAT